MEVGICERMSVDWMMWEDILIVVGGWGGVSEMEKERESRKEA